MFDVNDIVFRTKVANQWGASEEDLVSVSILGSLSNLRQFIDENNVTVLQQMYRVRVIFKEPRLINDIMTLENSKYIWLDVPVVAQGG